LDQASLDVLLVNSLYVSVDDVSVSALVFSVDAQLLGSQVFHADSVAADGVMTAGLLHVPSGITGAYFVRLSVSSAGSPDTYNNTYWMSTAKDVLDWSQSNFYRTACTSFADFSQLQTLPNITLEVAIVSSVPSYNPEYNRLTTVSVQNPSQAIALLVRVRLMDPTSNSDILPILWSDNYLVLLPGESQTLTALHRMAPGVSVYAVYELWNSMRQ
jgi:exo-1,4-beta-D-glucosaminidase